MSLGRNLCSGLILSLITGLVSALELQEVRLVGLFKDNAVIDVRGKQRILKVGQSSPEGIKLVATSKTDATLMIAGEQHRVALSRSQPRRYEKRESLTHSIAINEHGQYFTAGSINGQPVRFLVDTGATSVAMNTQQARRLGIDFARGKLGQVGTAGGIVKAYSLTLERVKVGGIEVKNVRASVLEGVYPVYVLLGMTYLRHVKMDENNGVMTLSKKY